MLVVLGLLIASGVSIVRANISLRQRAAQSSVNRDSMEISEDVSSSGQSANTFSATDTSNASQCTSQAVGLSVLGHQEGTLLWDRYHLLTLRSTGLEADALNAASAGSDELDATTALMQINADAEEETPHLAVPQAARMKYIGQKFVDRTTLGYTSAEIWTAYDKRTSRKVVLKVFYVKSGGRYKYLTTSDAYGGKDRRTVEVMQAGMRECMLAMKVHKVMKQRGQNYRGSRFVKCLALSERDDEPLYTVFSYHGPDTLQHYLRKWEPSLETTAHIFKQIAQAIRDLSSLDPPLVHHNLHRENIYVEGPASVPKLVFADFAAMREYTSKDPYKSLIIPRSMLSESSYNYAPPEWSLHYNSYTYCTNCEASFDIYSAGNLYVEVLTGRTAFELTSDPMVIGKLAPFGRFEFRRRSYAVLQQYLHQSRDPLQALVQLMQLHNKQYSKPAMSVIQQDGEASRFVRKYIPWMLEMDASKRIKPEDLLNSGWLRSMIIRGRRERRKLPQVPKKEAKLDPEGSLSVSQKLDRLLDHAQEFQSKVPPRLMQVELS